MTLPQVAPEGHQGGGRSWKEPQMPGGVTGRGRRQWKKSQAVVLM